MLLGLIVDWGGTGASNSGIGTPYSLLTPTYYFGKGFGDLPDSAGWLRAFAVTGQVGYQMPTRSFEVAQNAYIPQVLVYGGSLQYSMPYLKSEIQDSQLPDFINHLIPIVEAQLSTPVANNFGNSFVTTGTINPGVIWVGSYFQVGARSAGPGQPRQRHRRRRSRAVAPLSRRHVPDDDRTAAARRQRRPLPASSASEVKPCEHSSPSCRYSSSHRGRRMRLRRAGPRLSRSCKPAGRQHGARRAPREVALSFTQNLEAVRSAPSR